jgi:putative transposase
MKRTRHTAEQIIRKL